MGLDLGVYGLPETFVVGPDGQIAYKHIGPITEQVWRETRPSDPVAAGRVNRAARGAPAITDGC